MSRRRGFTLIELLVVIAIIGILAAMLFPVFARARESARKTQCLANVKNLAIAFNMYLVDYDRFPPDATSSEVTDYFYADYDEGVTGPGGDTLWNHATCASTGRLWGAVPYLRLPVILDDYVKNRDIWRCPSAKGEEYASFIVPDYPSKGGWLGYMKSTAGVAWGDTADFGRIGPCTKCWPSGWGGIITDSIAQGEAAGWEPEGGVFAQSLDINVGNGNAGLNLSSVDDTAKYVVVTETGFGKDAVYSALSIAFPDVCGAGCAICGGYGDWENCSQSQDCSIGVGDYAVKFATDPSDRKRWTRHMGGSNIGFADGHAKWYLAESILAQAPKYKGGCWCGPIVPGDLLGISNDGASQPAGGGPMPSDFNGCGVITPIY